MGMEIAPLARELQVRARAFMGKRRLVDRVLDRRRFVVRWSLTVVRPCYYGNMPPPADCLKSPARTMPCFFALPWSMACTSLPSHHVKQCTSVVFSLKIGPRESRNNTSPLWSTTNPLITFPTPGLTSW